MKTPTMLLTLCIILAMLTVILPVTAETPALSYRAEVTAFYGDGDRDGSVTSTDARLALQVSMGKVKETEIKEPAVFDVDGDGYVTSTDARMILQKSVGKVALFPTGTVKTTLFEMVMIYTEGSWCGHDVTEDGMPLYAVERDSLFCVYEDGVPTQRKVTFFSPDKRVILHPDGNGQVLSFETGPYYSCKVTAQLENGVLLAIDVYSPYYGGVLPDEPGIYRLSYSHNGVTMMQKLDHFTIQLDAEEPFVLVLYPNDLNDTEWYSSNPSVATIDSDGTVTTHKIGLTEIQATAGGEIYGFFLQVV